jgi:hypothetical protein
MSDPRFTLHRLLDEAPFTWPEVEALSPLSRQDAMQYLAGTLTDSRRLLYQLLFAAHPSLVAELSGVPIAEPPTVLAFHPLRQDEGTGTVDAEHPDLSMAAQARLSCGPPAAEGEVVRIGTEGRELRVFPSAEEGYYEIQFVGDRPPGRLTVLADGWPVPLATPFDADGFAQVREADGRMLLDLEVELDIVAD